MKLEETHEGQVFILGAGAVRSAKRALFAAAVLHTFVPLVLLAGLTIPFVLSTH